MTELGRPMVGRLVVPFMVDATRSPIDFKALDDAHIAACANQRLCGICGRWIRRGDFAFIGPDDGRICYADPWMHRACAELAMEQCPFLGGRGWRDPEDRDEELLQPYGTTTVREAHDGQAHRDPSGAWHFQARVL